ncbi:hypothetical protein C2845_PM05G01970 [Panicum miliaceum]|uniref:Uncharacterized protein n=1 Tax=Panicum miliaceum TaxID=4540 RepID=A0A3L6SYL6_PANMI|nr:hypothetical protein C2845_PM05G01970 [Panicum miliaceum]
MAIAAAYFHEDDEEMIAALRELVEDGADDTRGLGEDLRALRAKAAALEDTDALTPESWDWAENVERVARRAAETMAEEAHDIVQRALPLLSRRPGEEAFMAALRRQAATASALRADAEEDLRRLAAAEHLVDPDTEGFLGDVARETDASLERGEVPAPDDLAVAALVEDEAVRLEERMATLAGRLRRGAAEFAARPGEEALVDALHGQRQRRRGARHGRGVHRVRAPLPGRRRQRASRWGCRDWPRKHTDHQLSHRPYIFSHLLVFLDCVMIFYLSEKQVQIYVQIK